MTIKELTEKLAAMADYLRQSEQSREAETESQQADIDSLLARVAALEGRLDAIE